MFHRRGAHAQGEEFVINFDNILLLAILGSVLLGVLFAFMTWRNSRKNKTAIEQLCRDIRALELEIVDPNPDGRLANWFKMIKEHIGWLSEVRDDQVIAALDRLGFIRRMRLALDSGEGHDGGEPLAERSDEYARSRPFTDDHSAVPPDPTRRGPYDTMADRYAGLRDRTALAALTGAPPAVNPIPVDDNYPTVEVTETDRTPIALPGVPVGVNADTTGTGVFAWLVQAISGEHPYVEPNRDPVPAKAQ